MAQQGTILVTGATGQIGRELVQLLRRDGAPFRAFVRDLVRARASLGAGVELVQGDLADPSSLARALEDIDTVFLLSNNPSLEMSVVDEAIKRQVRRLVKSSAVGFKDQPPAGHGAVEEAIRRSGLTFTVLRPNAFMQTLAVYLPKLIGEDNTFALPAGEGSTAWVDTRDIAATAAALLQQHGHDNKVYEVTGPEALSMGDVAEILTEVTGTPTRYRAVPPEEAQRELRACGMEQMAGFLVEHYGAVERGGFKRVSDTVESVTGAQPRNFTAFATEHREMWRSN